MPIIYLRNLTAPERTLRANRHLGVSLAFIAGATNAGGFLAVGQYTSHMTGIVSAMADNLVLGEILLAGSALVVLIAFMSGAMVSAMLINLARRNRKRCEYALPLILEASLLVMFGMVGANLKAYVGFLVPVAVILLGFIMGLQNAIITKISHAEIRTTHVTGLVTDIGIELGKLFYYNQTAPNDEIKGVFANRERLIVHFSLLGSFFVGGLFGAISFKQFGYVSTLPLAMLLLLLAAVPVIDDLIMPKAAIVQPQQLDK